MEQHPYFAESGVRNAGPAIKRPIILYRIVAFLAEEIVIQPGLDDNKIRQAVKDGVSCRQVHSQLRRGDGRLFWNESFDHAGGIFKTRADQL